MAGTRAMLELFRNRAVGCATGRRGMTSGGTPGIGAVVWRAGGASTRIVPLKYSHMARTRGAVLELLGNRAAGCATGPGWVVTPCGAPGIGARVVPTDGCSTGVEIFEDSNMARQRAVLEARR